ncbi:hypothetical protein ElyMa_006460300 [Elysia marginata]|uniref:Uncharacterized protein n=1 Tax=Elysia marginata TaxID=1093978 RepID=A0AAV4I0P9_9GAST|nr:hypothetical protein ElyMa_006460300 [Elysia marginata]
MDVSVAIALVIALDSDELPLKRGKWSKDWFLKRETYGQYKLLKELRCNEPEDFRYFLGMDSQSFDELLGLDYPFKRKKDTVMRQSMPPSERMSITLRYLASGNSFEDLKFLTATSPQAIVRRAFANERSSAFSDFGTGLRFLIRGTDWLVHVGLVGSESGSAVAVIDLLQYSDSLSFVLSSESSPS